jgi:hypothetical protein
MRTMSIKIWERLRVVGTRTHQDMPLSTSSALAGAAPGNLPEGTQMLLMQALWLKQCGGG